MGKRSRQRHRLEVAQQRLTGRPDEWLCVQFTEHIKPHYVRRAQLPQLQRDLNRRYGATLTKQQVVTTGMIDLPGMICADRQFVTVPLDAHFSLEIPVTNVGAFRRELPELPRRTFADDTHYYKLHGYTRAVLLTPAHLATLQETLTALTPGAARQALVEVDRLADAASAAESRGLMNGAHSRAAAAALRRQLKPPQ
jgi:hypothetical protein